MTLNGRTILLRDLLENMSNKLTTAWKSADREHVFRIALTEVLKTLWQGHPLQPLAELPAKTQALKA